MKRALIALWLGAFFTTAGGPLLYGTACAQNASSPDNPPTVSEPYVATPAWWLEGAGALVMAGSMVVLTLGYSVWQEHTELQSEPDPDPNKLSELEQTGTAITTSGWIAFGVGAALIVGGTIWLIVDRTRRPSPPSSPAPASASAPPSQGALTLWQSGP